MGDCVCAVNSSVPATIECHAVQYNTVCGPGWLVLWCRGVGGKAITAVVELRNPKKIQQRNEYQELNCGMGMRMGRVLWAL